MFQKLRNCTICANDFLVFSRNSSAKICKECYPEYNRRKAREHYSRTIESGKVHEYRAKARERQRERHKDDATRLVARAKHRASTKGVSCTIKPSDLSIPRKCPILGTEFVSGTEYAMSIDAIDPAKGYTPDNVQVISMKANAMKNRGPIYLASHEKWTALEGSWAMVHIGNGDSHALRPSCHS